MAQSKVVVNQVEIDQDALAKVSLANACVMWDAVDKHTGMAVTVVFNVLNREPSYINTDGTPYCGSPDYLTSEVIDLDPTDSCIPTYFELYGEEYPEFFTSTAI